jgi:hypothetical protein
MDQILQSQGILELRLLQKLFHTADLAVFGSFFLTGREKKKADPKDMAQPTEKIQRLVEFLLQIPVAEIHLRIKERVEVPVALPGAHHFLHENPISEFRGNPP